MNLDALTAEVLERCEALARFSEVPGRLTRTFLRPPVRDVHERLTEWMREAGVAVRIDAMGNLTGRLSAPREDAHVFMVGSHIDSVPDAGKYDGVLGVLLGVAAAKALAGREFKRTLDVIAFSEEEGVRFRTPYLGSRAVCGRFDANLLELTDAGGVTLAQAIRDFGLDPARIPQAAYRRGQMTGYLEVHIEQGPVLESAGHPLGVVKAIVGQSRLQVKFTGKAGHAGTLPMRQRRDALTAAAEFVVTAEHYARATDGLRATVGRFALSPGAINVVPGEAQLTVDVRHSDDGVREHSVGHLRDKAHEIAQRRGLTVTIEALGDQPAVVMDEALTKRLSDAACATGHPPLVMDSGAGHDAAIMADLCPAAMLFLRSPGGISHHPDESVLPEDVRAALGVLIRFLETDLSAE
jgi:allantoate deiminase